MYFLIRCLTFHELNEAKGGGAGEKRLYDKYLYYLQARLNLHSLEVYSNLKNRKTLLIKNQVVFLSINKRRCCLINASICMFCLFGVHDKLFIAMFNLQVILYNH